MSIQFTAVEKAFSVGYYSLLAFVAIFGKTINAAIKRYKYFLHSIRLLEFTKLNSIVRMNFKDRPIAELQSQLIC